MADQMCEKCNHPMSWHGRPFGCSGVPGKQQLGTAGQCGCDEQPVIGEFAFDTQKKFGDEDE